MADVARARVVRFDLRGHGESDRVPPDTVTIERLADDLVEVVRKRVPGGRLVLVGHSLGAMVIMALVERRPELVDERVAGVVLYFAAEASLAGAVVRLPKWALTAGRKVTEGATRVAPSIPTPRRKVVMGPHVEWRTPDALRRVPVAVVAGSQDRLLTGDQARGIAFDLRRATFVQVVDAGLFMAFDQPIELARQIDRFAGRQ